MASDGDHDENYAVAYQLRSGGSNSRHGALEANVAGALLAAGARAGAGTTEETVVLLIDGVRRLTPTECERLQGLPDGWTIPFGPSLLDASAWHELRDRAPSLTYGQHPATEPLGDRGVDRVPAGGTAPRVQPAGRIPRDRNGAPAS